ncbi:MAG: 16S rRNA (cytidine(1402)-2'-O)-methyltransferase, partial [Clostridiales bacterium]|nr:16S rRNA (cytidine(1402)-2'-O)-methyltransferase [Clostridiales bacterium]
MTGTLHICGTPLGNLEDLTFRALRILKEADVIAAEDTRHTLKLLNHYDVKKPLLSFHEHNWKEKLPVIMQKLRDGQNVALVTDAGMPCISDPGQQLVDACLCEGLPVTSAPGPTALATAVALSGFPSSRFVFEGFLPRDGKRAKILQEIGAEKRAVVLYEAPHHLKELLSDL